MDTASRLILIATLQSQHDAALVVDRLRRAGFDGDDVSVQFGEARPLPTNLEAHGPLTNDCRGAIQGVFLGGILGFFVGAIAALAGPATVSTRMMEILAMGLGFGAGGIVTGGMLGAIINSDDIPVTTLSSNQECTIVTVRAGQRTLELFRNLDCQTI